MTGSETSQYAAAAYAPLIKNPSLRVPEPATLPPDIHPLPDTLADYMVYPYTLEPHVLALESARRTTAASHAARREAYLKHRDEEKERRRRETLRRVAPGFDPSAPLVPTRALHSPSNSVSAPTPAQSQPSVHSRTKSVMDDLVEQLAVLDAAKSAGRTPSPGPLL
ncbi:hypothetical protein EXIGLDRAFT_777784 [Exidia glandulosa HHB12029]|uniref:Uncharacterized protein n=1 Tax=Exidia glandulosa HHB12029 TaxID=1314781 RepID=A0A165CVH9_EXIGL|nr:hypothetical protein EXIGLDRAFT_777784 [Exidia glandulosa HHB12029]